jgi:hypothetical protein
MHRYHSRGASVKYMLAGGTVIAAFSLLAESQGSLPAFPGLAANAAVCQEMVQTQAVLSREQLAKLLTLPERSPKTQVQQVVKTPYCRLSNLSVRAGVSAQREVYPLAFDPQTLLVVLYEGDEYAGYSFSFGR